MKDDSVRSYIREIDVITVVFHDKDDRDIPLLGMVVVITVVFHDKNMTNMTRHYLNTHLFIVNSSKLITLKHYRIVFVMKH